MTAFIEGGGRHLARRISQVLRGRVLKRVGRNISNARESLSLRLLREKSFGSRLR